jgi:flavin reductase (DIM6/NTAB) family NADH-FMN oxidoreductase RutF
MELPWNDPRSKKFVTTVGLITSEGIDGPNIMACKWTHHISYNPGLIAISLGLRKATVKNIRKTKEFGINLCSTDQSILSSIAGEYSGSNYDKISASRELGFEFYKANKIKALMVKGASLNAECKLFQELTFGDYIMFIGEVIDATHNSEKQPLVYHDKKYWALESPIKPKLQEIELIQKVIEKHKKIKDNIQKEK